jgi:hypothetical protein
VRHGKSHGVWVALETDDGEGSTEKLLLLVMQEADAVPEEEELSLLGGEETVIQSYGA